MNELPYEAVLCDVDGVLRHWPDMREIDLRHGLPAGALATAAFAPDRLVPAITGLVTDEQWRSAVASDLAVHHGAAAASAAVAAWADAMPVVDEEVADLLRRARGIVPVALVSNGTTRLERDLARQALGDVADVVVNTARIGVAKPDPRVFTLAATRVGAPVEGCLFVDDTRVVVDAAHEAGMFAVLHQRPDDLRTALEPLFRHESQLGGTTP